MTCEHVIAVDIDPRRLRMAAHNAEVYGVRKRIEFIQADYMALARTGRLRADVVCVHEYVVFVCACVYNIFLSTCHYVSMYAMCKFCLWTNIYM